MNQVNKYGIGPNDDALVTLGKFFDNQHFDKLLTVLCDCMKCNLGNDIEAGTHDPYLIAEQVETVADILKFLRLFQADLRSVEIIVKDDHRFVAIEYLFSALNYEVAYDILMYGLNEWIFQDFTVYNRSPSEALTIVTVYERIEDILTKCFGYYQFLKSAYQSEQ